MKTRLKFALVVAFVAIAGYGVYANQKLNFVSDLALSDVASIAACESIGWVDNNGNCVKNDSKEYFCKSDTWHELTDCLQ